VTVTDDNGCYADTHVTVGATTAIELAFDAWGVSCHDGNDGTAEVHVSGGVEPLVYAWSNGATTAKIKDLIAGTYHVTVTDARGCVKIGKVRISEPKLALTATAQTTDATCGLNNGAVTVTAAGGTNPYTYAWGNGSTGETITGLDAGDYTVTVTDDNGCTTTITGTVNRIGSAVQLSLAGKDLNCFRSGDGSVTATITGGIAPYTYIWSNAAVTQNLTGLQVGTYALTVTDSKGCTATASATISEPAALNLVVIPKPTTCGLDNGSIRSTVEGGTTPYKYAWSNGATTAHIGPLAAGTYHVTVTDAHGCFTNSFTTIDPSTAPSIAMAHTDVACFDGNDGSATATVTKGIAPYTYEWSNGATTNAITHLTAGIYKLTVTDNNACTTEASVTIAQPPLLTVAIAKVNATCGLPNGSATTTVTGGTAPFTYAWSNGATTAHLTNLIGGTFTLTVTDAHQCKATNTVTITNTPPITSVSVTTTAVKCFGGNDGAATTSVVGGTAPLTYAWSHNATGASVTGLIAGNYSVTVTDAIGCTKSQTFTITQPTLLVVTAVEVQKATCAPIGKASSTVTGGTAPYRYFWSNNSALANLENVLGGTYTVTVLDANDCRAITSVEVRANTSPNLACAIAETQAISDAGGTDGKAKVTVTGYNGALTYKWSNGQTTATATGLGALTYWVTVTDGYSCTTKCSIKLKNPPCDNVTDPGQIGTATEGYCPGSTIDPITNVAPATGGSGTLEYVWMYSRFNIPFSPNSWEMVRGQNGTDLSGAAIQALDLTDTTYFIRCVRRNGCSFKESNQVIKYPRIIGEAVIPDPICVGRTVTFEAPDNGSGSSGIYSWSFGPYATPSTSTNRVQNVTFTSSGRQNVQLSIHKNACLSVRSYPIDASSCVGSGTDVGSLKVTAVNHHEITLSWVTRNEKEQAVYSIERSADGGNTFEQLHDMPSLSAALVNNYRWNDVSPKMGHSFYRIRRIGFGGTMNYTHAEGIMMSNGDAKLLAYPNPAGNVLFVESLDHLSDGTIEIYNETGTLVHLQEFQKADTRYSIDMSHFSKGLYLVKTRLNTGETNVVRVTKF
jgi:SprB repeat/Secretion system C-terminal sorting domain